MAAEAERDAAVALAEGKAKSIELVYNAEADGLRKLAECGVNEGVLRLKSIEAMKDIADGRATKVFIPNDLSQSLIGSGLTGEMLGVAPKPETMPARQDYRKSVVDAGAKKTMSADACFSNPESGKAVLKSGATNARLGSEMKQKTLY